MENTHKENNFPLPAGDLILSSSKNEELIEMRHQQIVEGACKVFFTKGYHPTTIREIAEACSMSMGQLYHYISTKDDVLYLVHKHMHKVWYDYLKNSGIEDIDDPLEKLTCAIRHTLRFMVENRKLIQFVYSESKYLDKRHLRVVLEMDNKMVVTFWRNLLEGASKVKSLKGDLDFLASLIAFLIVFLPLRGWTLRDKPMEGNIESLREFMLRGLGFME